LRRPFATCAATFCFLQRQGWRRLVIESRTPVVNAREFAAQNATANAAVSMLIVSTHFTKEHFMNVRTAMGEHTRAVVNSLLARIAEVTFAWCAYLQWSSSARCAMSRAVAYASCWSKASAVAAGKVKKLALRARAHLTWSKLLQNKVNLAGRFTRDW
jgi:hypothetical protein